MNPMAEKDAELSSCPRGLCKNLRWCPLRNRRGLQSGVAAPHRLQRR